MFRLFDDWVLKCLMVKQ